MNNKFSNEARFRRIWDTHTGETLYILQENHIVRALAFPPDSGHLLATGGMEKKLRIYDLSKAPPPPSQGTASPPIANGNGVQEPVTIAADTAAVEIGAGVHKGTIKCIVWTRDPNVLVTVADDKIIRWWDLGSGEVLQEQQVQGEIGTCEFSNTKSEASDVGGGLPVLTIAAGRTVYFYGGPTARQLLKQVTLPYEVASAAFYPAQRKFVTGGIKDTWAKVYDYDSEQEIGMFFQSLLHCVFLPSYYVSIGG